MHGKTIIMLCDAMYEVLNTFKWKLIPKFQWKLINFEKPQNFSKTPKPRFQNMKCINVKGLEAYQGKKFLKKLEESLRNQVWSEMRLFWERKQRSIEKEIEENDFRIAQRPYIEQPVNLDRCRYREVSSDLSRRCRGIVRRQLRCRGGIEDQHTRI